MLESCAPPVPTRPVMAAGTFQRKARSHVIGVRRRLIIGQMAAAAVQRQINEFSVRMTALAIQRLMWSGQGKAGLLMVLFHGSRLVPTRWRMATVAFRTELTAMDIEMAIRTGRRCPGKNQGLVTFTALDLLMPFHERELRLAVIKTEILAQRLPPFQRMTLITGQTQFTVRILSMLRPTGP